MTDKSMTEQVKEALVEQAILEVESFRCKLAEKILLADVRARGAQHTCMADKAVNHANDLIKLLSRAQQG